MKWITRDHVHMDRVASPWLIRRFVDPEAVFGVVPFATPAAELPGDAIPYGIPGVELGAHDAEGSTFRKILRKYALTDPALQMLGGIVDSGITHVFALLKTGQSDVGALPRPEGVGLDAISQGMMLITRDDVDNIETSMLLYDALYAYCRAKLLLQRRPEITKIGHPEQWDVLKQALADEAKE